MCEKCENWRLYRQYHCYKSLHVPEVFSVKKNNEAPLMFYKALMKTSGATKGGAGGGLSTPQSKIGVPCNSCRSVDFFWRGGGGSEGRAH
jgi:hypothetical protein